MAGRKCTAISEPPKIKPMQNVASDLLLLVTNLSQLKSISRVKSIFTESLAEIFANSNVKWLEKSEANTPEIIPVCTRSKTYGYIEISKSILAQNANLLPHIQNSVQLLAIILERIEQENALKKYQGRLENIIYDQTQSIIEKNNELNETNEELAVANEELSVSNKSLIDINKNLYSEIEKREKAEKERNAYADENELFRNALDKIPSYVYMKDLEGCYIYANQHSLDLFNCKADELHGKTDFDFFKNDNAQKLREIDKKVIESKVDSVEELSVATTN